MRSDADMVQRQLFELGQGASKATIGTVTAQDWDNLLVTVDVGGSLQDMRWSGSAPWVGDQVHVTFAGLVPTCAGVYGAPIGTVLSVSGGLCRVTGQDGVVYRYPHTSGSVPAVGALVELIHERRKVGATYAVAPEGSEVVPQDAPPKPAGGLISKTFKAVDAGNYRNGSWNPGPLSISDTRSAYLFYGHQIADTIPNSAAIKSATVSFAETYDYVAGTPSRLGYHTHGGTHPSSPPSLTGSIFVSGSGAVDILAFAPSLVVGAAFGLGFPAGFGYREFVGAADITIKYTV